MLGNGAGNGFGFTGLAGVVAADDAFELGELEHHVGDQVGLGQCGGARGGVGIRAQGFGQRGGQGFQATGLVGIAAESFLEGDLVESFAELGQRLLAVLLPEEQGVFQARADHAFVAQHHLLDVQ